MNERPVRFQDFQARSNRFRVQDILIRCNQVANFASSRPLGEALLPLRTTSRTSPVESLVIAPWSLAFIAKTSLLKATDNRQQQLTDQEFAMLYAMQSELEDAFLEPSNKDLRGFLLRTGWEQFPLQEATNRAIPRALMLLVDANRNLGGSPIDVEAVWVELTGIPIEKFMKIGFAYWAGAAKNAILDRHFACTGPFAGEILPEDCEAFLRFTSATYEEFRQLSARSEYRIPDPLYAKTEFNALLVRPLIAISRQANSTGTTSPA